MRWSEETGGMYLVEKIVGKVEEDHGGGLFT